MLPFKTMKEKLHDTLTCKDTNKLQKPLTMTFLHKPRKQKKSEKQQKLANWKAHNLSAIAEDFEPLCPETPSPRPGSSSSSSSGCSLLDDPAILKLCSLDFPEEAIRDRRCSSKIVISEPGENTFDFQLFPSEHQKIQNLETELQQTRSELHQTRADLAHKSTTLTHISRELHFLRSENGIRFIENRNLKAQLNELEHVGGWSKKKLKQHVVRLVMALQEKGDALMQAESRIESQVGVIQWLEEDGEKLVERCRRLEGRKSGG